MKNNLKIYLLKMLVTEKYYSGYAICKKIVPKVGYFYLIPKNNKINLFSINKGELKRIEDNKFFDYFPMGGMIDIKKLNKNDLTALMLKQKNKKLLDEL